MFTTRCLRIRGSHHGARHRLDHLGLVLALAAALAVGCDSGGNHDADIAPTDTPQVDPDTVDPDVDDDATDTAEPDDTVDPDTTDATDTADTTLPPVSGNGPDRAAISAGGGRVQGSTYQLELSIGAPISAPAVQGSRFQAHIGVGPYISLPAAGTENP